MEARQLSRYPQPFRLSLRVRHPSMDPADLSRQLKIKPEHSYRAGEPRSPRMGRALASVHAESYWLGALDPGRWSPDISFPEYPKLQVAAEHLQATAANSLSFALSLSTTRFFHLHAELLRRIRSEGGQVSLLVSLVASEVGSFRLMPEVSRALGEFDVTVEFEFTEL